MVGPPFRFQEMGRAPRVTRKVSRALTHFHGRESQRSLRLAPDRLGTVASIARACDNTIGVNRYSQ